MAKEHLLSIKAHPSVYNPAERTLDIFYCLPECGINPQTGVLLLIAGFGGQAESKVYYKMRHQFADAYNLVTIQCNYFGYEFMQDCSNPSFEVVKDELRCFLTEKQFNEVYQDNHLDLTKLRQMELPSHLTISAFETLNETLSNFNDMGLMQAVDNITAILTVIIAIYKNNHQFNTKKIIAYGHSHGRTSAI